MQAAITASSSHACLTFTTACDWPALSKPSTSASTTMTSAASGPLTTVKSFSVTSASKPTTRVLSPAVTYSSALTKAAFPVTTTGSSAVPSTTSQTALTRKTGVVIPQLPPNTSLDTVLSALAQSSGIAPQNFTHGSAVHGIFHIYFKNESFASSAILSGLDLGANHYDIRPLVHSMLRITISNIPPEVPHSFLRSLLQRYGRIVGSVRNLKSASKLRDFSHLYGFRRQVFMEFSTEDEVTKIPPRLHFTLDGFNYTIYLTVEKPCTACSGFGHTSATCPQRSSVSSASSSFDSDTHYHPPSSVPTTTPLTPVTSEPDISSVFPPTTSAEKITTSHSLDPESSVMIIDQPPSVSTTDLPPVHPPTTTSASKSPQATSLDSRPCPLSPDRPLTPTKKARFVTSPSSSSPEDPPRKDVPIRSSSAERLETPPPILMDTTDSGLDHADQVPPSIAADAPSAPTATVSHAPHLRSSDAPTHSASSDASIFPDVAGPLTSSRLHQFLQEVKGSPSPLTFVPQYTSDFPGLIAQLKELAAQLKRSKNRQSDATRISNLAKRLEKGVVALS